MIRLELTKGDRSVAIEAPDAYDIRELVLHVPKIRSIIEDISASSTLPLDKIPTNQGEDRFWDAMQAALSELKV